MVHIGSIVGYFDLPHERIDLKEIAPRGFQRLTFVAVMGSRAFGHTVAAIRRVGPIGGVAVQFRTEEPGEQRFCQDQRLKQPMGLPFSEWADCKIQSLAGYASRYRFNTTSLPWPLQQISTAFTSNS
jgi:hypothetical protein